MFNYFYQFFYNPTPLDIILVLILVVVSRLSPAGRWNYKRTKYLREQHEKGLWIPKKEYLKRNR